MDYDALFILITRIKYVYQHWKTIGEDDKQSTKQRGYRYYSDSNYIVVGDNLVQNVYETGCYVLEDKWKTKLKN